MSFPEPQPQTRSIYVPGAQQQFGHPSTWPQAQQPQADAAPPSAPTPVTPQRRSRLLPFTLGAIGAAIALLVGFGVYFVALRGVTISGVVALAGAGRGFSTTECRGTGGYSDLARGAQVTVTDAAGKAIALGRLEAGKSVKDDCLFAFNIDAPRADFYGIEVSHRGVVRYSRAEVEKGVVLGIGF